MTLNPKLGLNHPELAVCDPWGKDLCLVDFSPTGQEEEDPAFLSLSLSSPNGRDFLIFPISSRRFSPWGLPGVWCTVRKEYLPVTS